MQIKEYVLSKGGTVEFAEDIKRKYPYTEFAELDSYPPALKELVDTELDNFLSTDVPEVVKFFVDKVSVFGVLTTLTFKHNEVDKYYNEIYKGKEVVLKMMPNNEIKGIIYNK